MSWKRALEADARLAAKNAVKIRAALRQSINAEQIAAAYLHTHPQPLGNMAQSRARAKAWAIMNVRPNMEALKTILLKTLAEAYALGDLAALEQVELAKKRTKAPQTGINWATWKPGDAAAAILVKPPKAFKALLQRFDINLKGFSDTTLDGIGNSLGESIELGLSQKQTAKGLIDYVGSASRAMTIAVTEQNRAISAATVARYQDMGVEKNEWAASDPCPECAENDGVVVPVGENFPSGDDQPPVHPNCRCTLLPVVPGMDEEESAIDGGAGITDPSDISEPEPAPAPVITEQDDPVAAFHRQRLHEGSFVPGKWKQLSKEQIETRTKEKLYETYERVGYSRESIDKLLARHSKFRADRSLIEKGSVYVNGNVEVQFHSGGASVPKKRKEEIVKAVDELQQTNPNGKVTVIVGPTKKGAYGWAYLNGDKIWLAPKTAKTSDPNLVEGGSYKMPILRETPQWKYTLTHEWGHHIDKGSPFHGQDAARTSAIQRLKAQFPEAFKSGYSLEKPEEFVAEMFAEWKLTNGQTSNALTQAVAKEFGWNK